MDTRPGRLGDGSRAPSPHLRPPAIIPPDAPLPFPASVLAVIRNPIESWCKSVYEEPIFFEQVPGQLLAYICEPAAVRAILQDTGDTFPKSNVDRRLLGPMVGEGVLTSEGEQWRWQRRTTAPLFRHSELLGYVKSMSSAADRAVGRWRNAGPRSVQHIDQAMIRASFEIIAETMLPADESFDIGLIERCMSDYLAVSTWDIAYALLRVPTWMPFPGKRRSRKAARDMRASMAAIIQDRNRSGRQADDLLGRMMAAADPETDQPMQQGQVIDNLLTFLLAGHETTATLLTWTLYLLASAPDWQERLAAEVESVVGYDEFDAEHIAQLGLTRQVIHEAARLYPPVPILSRMAVRDIEIEGTAIPAGTLCIIPIYAIHRHHSLWDDPDIFDPGRFSDDLHADRARCTYMPFGAGPRICMGAAFANMEATIILANFMRSVRFELTPDIDPTPVARVSLRPRGGMPLKVVCPQRAA